MKARIERVQVERLRRPQKVGGGRSPVGRDPGAGRQGGGQSFRGRGCGRRRDRGWCSRGRLASWRQASGSADQERPARGPGPAGSACPTSSKLPPMAWPRAATREQHGQGREGPEVERETRHQQVENAEGGGENRESDQPGGRRAPAPSPPALLPPAGDAAPPGASPAPPGKGRGAPSGKRRWCSA